VATKMVFLGLVKRPINILTKCVTHVWNVDTNGHDNTEWDRNLYLFSQHIF